MVNLSMEIEAAPAQLASMGQSSRFETHHEHQAADAHGRLEQQPPPP